MSGEINHFLSFQHPRIPPKKTLIETSKADKVAKEAAKAPRKGPYNPNPTRPSRGCWRGREPPGKTRASPRQERSDKDKTSKVGKAKRQPVPYDQHPTPAKLSRKGKKTSKVTKKAAKASRKGERRCCATLRLSLAHQRMNRRKSNNKVIT